MQQASFRIHHYSFDAGTAEVYSYGYWFHCFIFPRSEARGNVIEGPLNL